MKQSKTHRRGDGAAVRAVAAIALHVFVPLGCGSAVYLCFRPTNLGVFGWIRYAGLSDAVIALREFIAPGRSYLPGWFVYSLPDGLWCYATTAAATLLWGNVIEPAGLRMPGVNIGLVAGCAIELLQRTGMLDGTADPVDVALACAGSIAARRAVGGRCFDGPLMRREPDAPDGLESGATEFHVRGGARWRQGAIR